jgi:hypothetical protein
MRLTRSLCLEEVTARQSQERKKIDHNRGLTRNCELALNEKSIGVSLTQSELSQLCQMFQLC